MTNPKTLYGIIGYPVEHSLSPFMHNTAFKALDVDAEYRLFPLMEDEVKPFFEDLRESNNPIFGLNVTVPYKEKVLEYCDSLTPFASRAMSVNTIVISPERKISGFNTDGPGFLAHLEELKFDVKDKRIVVLGAGGTTRAIIAALCLLPGRPASIRIYNRTMSNAQALVASLGKQINVGTVEVVPSVDDLNIELADLLINTTSVGLLGDDPGIIDEKLLHRNLLVYDVIYNPSETKLLKAARAKGAKTANGLGLLFYQGVLAFQHWANMELDEEIKAKMRKSLELKKEL